MHGLALKLYHRLPAAGRSAAASLRGYYLRAWRYGPKTEELVAEALERDRWSPERWRRWQEERLASTLHRAATRVPHYRRLWAERRRKGDRRPWDRLENWPVLEKEALRAEPRAFLADDVDPRGMFHEHTSGTTGKPISLWLTRDTVRRWYALIEARSRRWYGVSRADRWANLGGQLVTPVARRRPPFWVWNAGLRQLYMSSYHLAPDLIPHYAEALRRHRVRHVLGYASSLYSLALGILEHGETDLGMKAVVSNAEPLFDHQRRAIAEAFRCPVFDSYGMAEMVAAASECGSRALHWWPEVGVTEVLDAAEGGDGAGDLVCTGILNADMPLIRYRVGDRARAGSGRGPCECGRLLPTVAAIEGRRDDVLYTRDGRPIGRLDPVFKADLPLREAQIIQETLDRVTVRVVPTPDFSTRHARDIRSRVRDRMGDVEVDIERVDEIPRQANGKFRAVVSRIPSDERPGAANAGRERPPGPDRPPIGQLQDTG